MLPTTQGKIKIIPTYIYNKKSLIKAPAIRFSERVRTGSYPILDYSRIEVYCTK